MMRFFMKSNKKFISVVRFINEQQQQQNVKINHCNYTNNDNKSSQYIAYYYYFLKAKHFQNIALTWKTQPKFN